MEWGPLRSPLGGGVVAVELLRIIVGAGAVWSGVGTLVVARGGVATPKFAPMGGSGFLT